jgi:hypothetical protein
LQPLRYRYRTGIGQYRVDPQLWSVLAEYVQVLFG